MKLASLQNNIIFLCSNFTLHFSSTLSNAFRKNELPITAEQFSILVLLWYEEGLAPKQIAEYLDKDKTTIARVVLNMERKKLLIQKTNQTDHRFKKIYLTKKGKEIQSKALGLSGKLYTKVLSSLTNHQIDEGIELLTAMKKNLLAISL